MSSATDLKMTIPAPASLSVGEAAELLGRDRTRVYALLRSGDLVAAPGTDGDDQALRIDRSSVERGPVAGGSRGGPLTPRNAWAIIGLASGDEALAQRCLGLLERRLLPKAGQDWRIRTRQLIDATICGREIWSLT